MAYSPKADIYDPTNTGSAESSDQPLSNFFPVQQQSAVHRQVLQPVDVGAVMRSGDFTVDANKLGKIDDPVKALAVEEVDEVAKAGPSGLSKERSEYYTGRWRSYDVGASRPVNVNALQKESVDFFKSKGWTQAQAVGLVANITAESGLRTTAVGDGGKAYGICQWHPDRQEEFARFAGHDIRSSTLQEQLGFVHHELTDGREKKAGNNLRGAQTPAEAAAVISTYYERPADTDGQALARAKLANGIHAGLVPEVANGADLNKMKSADAKSGNVDATVVVGQQRQASRPGLAPENSAG